MSLEKDTQNQEVNELKEMIKELDAKQDRQTDNLNDIRVSVAKQETSFELHMKQDERMYEKIQHIDDKLGHYNQLLALHIEGVNQLKVTNSLLEKKIENEKTDIHARLSVLETSAKWGKETANRLIKFSAVMAAVLGIAKTIEALLSKWHL